MLLTAREVAELTGRERRPAQCRALDAMGVPYRVRPDGSPAVLRYEPHRRPAIVPLTRKCVSASIGQAYGPPERRSPART